MGNFIKNIGNKKLYIGIAALVIISIVVIVILQTNKYETTDNAQLDGDVVTLKTSLNSYVEKIYFKDNQQVKKGDTLMKLNSKQFNANVQKTKAALEKAKAEISVMNNEAEASVQNAEASEKIALSNKQAIQIATANLKRAKEEYQRNQKLFDIKAITQKQLNDSENELQIAQADLAQAVTMKASAMATASGKAASAKSSTAAISSGTALLEQRKAELALAEYDLHNTYIIAPCSGIVTKRTVQKGTYVAVGQNLCAIVNNQNLWITANVKETQLENIRPGQLVEIEIDAYPELVLKGEVSSFGGATGAKFSLLPPDNATGNFVKVVQRVPIRISLKENPSKYPDTPLLPGLSASVSIKINTNEQS